MTDRRIEKIYNSTINNITNRVKKSNQCMNRATNNPNYIYLLGNKCIKPDVKSRKKRKQSKRYMKKKGNRKTHRVKLRQKGGGLFGNVINGVNGLTSGVREVLPPQSVLPWEGNFNRKF